MPGGPLVALDESRDRVGEDAETDRAVATCAATPQSMHSYAEPRRSPHRASLAKSVRARTRKGGPRSSGIVVAEVQTETGVWWLRHEEFVPGGQYAARVLIFVSMRASWVREQGTFTIEGPFGAPTMQVPTRNPVAVLLSALLWVRPPRMTEAMIAVPATNAAIPMAHARRVPVLPHVSTGMRSTPSVAAACCGPSMLELVSWSVQVRQPAPRERASPGPTAAFWWRIPQVRMWGRHARRVRPSAQPGFVTLVDHCGRK